MKKIVIIISFVAVLLTLYLSLKDSSADSRITATPSEYELSKIEEKEDSKQSGLSDLSKMRKTMLDQAPIEAEEEEEEPLSERDQRILDLSEYYEAKIGGKELHERSYDALDKIIESEPPNAVWQNQVKEDSLRFLDKLDLKETQLEKVDCGTTLCRARFSHQEDEQTSIHDNSGSPESPWAGGHQRGHRSIELGDNKYGTVVFFSRENDYEPFLRMLEIAAHDMNIPVLPRGF